MKKFLLIFILIFLSFASTANMNEQKKTTETDTEQDIDLSKFCPFKICQMNKGCICNKNNSSANH